MYDYEIPGWYVNAVVQGKLTDKGMIKVTEYEAILDRDGLVNAD